MAEEWLPRLGRIEDRLIHLAQVYARIRHVLRLGGSGELPENVLRLKDARPEAKTVQEEEPPHAAAAQ